MVSPQVRLPSIRDRELLERLAAHNNCPPGWEVAGLIRACAQALGLHPPTEDARCESAEVAA